MKTSGLSNSQLKKLCHLYMSGNINITQAAKAVGAARNTIKRHIRILDRARDHAPQCALDLKGYLDLFQAKPCTVIEQFRQLLPGLIKAKESNCTVKQLWLSYRELNPSGYCYSQFAHYYARCYKSEPDIPCYHMNHYLLPAEDSLVLQSWRRSADRRKWEKAVVLLDTAEGHPIRQIAGKIERSTESVRHWLHIYRREGLIGLQQKKRETVKEVTRQIVLKKENLIRLLHEAPQLHGFNRTSWRLKDLSAAYQKNYGIPLSVPTISVYIRQEGYVFRKARKVLTSPDPDFRKKLIHIQTILQHLNANEKFFSIDEYGPFSIKMKGGRSLVKRGESKTFPQQQASKGFLICTAALELSTNQMTHFYSKKKDTTEMIKLIDLLCERYHDQDKLYLSWDAAIWHASKKLNAYLDDINADSYRTEHHTPLVELAPLPASAQFLNVIESVFSGLAKSVIHHSDYASVGHCQAAIDRYFKERNQHFALHPKKAGKKIWGEEKTIAEFRDSHNCKDPAWR